MIVVTSTADDGPGSLRRALAAASNGDTITITAAGTIALTTGELLVNKSVTIRGPGAAYLSVSGNSASRVFHITPDSVVTISALTITNGAASAAAGVFPANAGGGIYSDHATLTVSECVVTGNSARFGGGLFSDARNGRNATVAIHDSTFSDNSASYVGGAIFSGGGFFNTGPSGRARVTINGGVIGNNSAAFGGGIFNDGFSGAATLTLTNSVLKDNLGQSAGGGIYNNGDSGVATVTLVDSVVSGNSAHDPNFPGGGVGGGILNDGSWSVGPPTAILVVRNSAVNGNFAGKGGGIFNLGFGSFDGRFTSTVMLTSTFIMGNRASRGGGIYNHAGSVTLDDTTVSGNEASPIEAIPGGGGILSVGDREFGGSFGLALLTLTDSVVSGNTALLFGGGIWNTLDSTATLTNSTVSGNSAPVGGGIFNDSLKDGTAATLTLNNSTLSGNFGWSILNLTGSLASATADIANTVLDSGALSGNILNVVDNPDGTLTETSLGFTSHGYNISSDAAQGDGTTAPGGLLNGPGDMRNTNPQLGPLQDNGGPTSTHALLVHSPAIDAGDPSFDPKSFDPQLRFDQRGPGFPRVRHGRVDIGAFEFTYPGETEAEP